MDIPKYKLIGWLSALLLVLLITFYVLEFDYIGNTLNYERLFLKTFMVAIFIGIYLGWRFQGKGEEQVDKIRIWSAAILLPLFFSPWLASLTNRLSLGKTIYQTVEFIEARPYSNSFEDLYGIMELKADGCFIFIFYQGEIHRLKQDKCPFLTYQNGDKVRLPMKKGLWGHEVVLFE